MTLKPFRVQMDFTAALQDLDRATTLHDRLLDLAEDMGLAYEGGFIEQIPLKDVIPDSPLDRDLAAA